MKKKAGGYKLMNEGTIKAVHDSDVQELLTSLGEWGAFSTGQCQCAFCGDVVSDENFGAIFPDNNSVGYACNKSVCMRELTMRGHSDGEH